MENRVPALLEKILGEPSQIKDITASDNEYYFRFSNHVFSILHSLDRPSKWGPYSFYVYPRWTEDLRALAAQSRQGELPDSEMVSYHSAQFSFSPIYQDLFESLYSLLKAKHTNVDRVFDDILGEE